MQDERRIEDCRWFGVPLSLVTLTQAILAKKGSGKTYTAAVIAEEMLTSGLPVTIIDPTGAWWGIKSSADGECAGYPVVVFGGDHADVNIAPDSGEATVANIKANSVESLEAELARLKSVLESKTTSKVAPDAIQRAVESERERAMQEYQQLALKLSQSVADAQRNLRDVSEAISHLMHDGVHAPAAPQSAAGVSGAVQMRSSFATMPNSKQTKSNHVQTTNGTRTLSGTSLKIAQIAAGYGASGKRIERSILAAMCGVVDGGSFSARLSEAKSAGAVLIDDGVVHATPDGVAAYAGQFRAPASTDDVLAIWLPKLGGVSRKVLEHLVSLRGAPVSRPDLAAAVGVVDGGSFSARVSEVRRTGLLSDAGRGHITANVEALFLS